MKTLLIVLAAAATLVTHALSHAQTGGSLNEARSAITKGTAPGIVIIGAKRRPPEASAAASAAAAAAPVATATATTGSGAAAPATARKADTPAAATPLAERVGAALKWGEAPGGLPLNAARRLDSPTLGIPLQSAKPAASQAAAK
jgi:hypothetical protein